jgi:hypothetical protein
MRALRSSISYAALGTAVGFAVIAGAAAANAQTVITPQPVAMQTITTETRTVRTVPAHTVRRQVITTRTVTQRVVPTTVIGRSVATYPQPIYDEVVPAAAPAVVATTPDYSRPLYNDYSRPLYNNYNYSRPLYDEVVATPPASVIDNGSILATQPYIYRYVYEPNRILVIDPATGNAIQSIPR